MSSKEHCHGCGKLWSEESPDCVFNYHKKPEITTKINAEDIEVRLDQSDVNWICKPPFEVSILVFGSKKEAEALKQSIINNDEIVSRIRDRLKECETNSNGINAKDNWKEYSYQIKLAKELKSILEKKE